MSRTGKIIIFVLILLAVGGVIYACTLWEPNEPGDVSVEDFHARPVDGMSDMTEAERLLQASILESEYSELSHISIDVSEISEESDEVSGSIGQDLKDLARAIMSGTYRPTIHIDYDTSTEESQAYDNPIVEPKDDPDADTSETVVKPSSYTVTIRVINSAGEIVPNAKVQLESSTGTTDSKGQVILKTTYSDPILVVSGTGLVPYYEELELTLADSFMEVILADSDRVRTLLNQQELRPYVTNDSEINAYIDALLSEITDDSMDTYTKVSACYEYMIAHTYYKSPSHWKRPYQKYYWTCGYQCLCEGYGTCNCYSAAFTLMMRRIGLDCYVVEGYTSSSKGGFTSHEWPVIKMNSQYYIFDCQVEDAIMTRAGSKEITHIRFCLEQDHPKYQYRKTTLKYEVDEFAKYAEENGHYLDGKK